MEGLDKVLADHKLWIRTFGEEGKRADLRNANLGGAKLAGARLREAMLSGANFIGADLSSAALRDADLVKASLLRARLTNADLSGANLYGAMLGRAEMVEADLTGADLRNADLRDAILDKADLRDAGVNGANFTNARFMETRFSNREQVYQGVFSGYEGIVFDEVDEEKIGKESRERDRTVKELFGKETSIVLSFRLPETYPPAKIAHILILMTLLYEGARLAMTAPFDEMGDLMARVAKPELYGAFEDETSLKLASIKEGSWVGELLGNKGLAGFILGLFNFRQNMLLKKLEVKEKELEIRRKHLEVQDKEARIVENRKIAVIDTHLPMINSARQDYDSLVASLDAPGLSEEERKLLTARLGPGLDRIDRLNDRLDLVTRQVDRSHIELHVIGSRLGGEFELLGENLLPPGTESG